MVTISTHIGRTMLITLGFASLDLVGSIAERTAVTRLVKLAGLLGALLGLAHRAKVYVEEAYRKCAEHGKDAEVQRDGLEAARISPRPRRRRRR